MILALLWGCGGSPDADSADTCADATVLSWNDVGEPLLREHCQSCHASTATDRYGAPEAAVFDTYADVVAQRDAILARVEPDPPTMPPAMPLPDADRALLVSWLRCDVP